MSSLSNQFSAAQRRRLKILGGLCAASYAIGYSWARIDDSPWAWGLVWLGGLFLFAIGVIAVPVLVRLTPTDPSDDTQEPSGGSPEPPSGPPADS